MLRYFQKLFEGKKFCIKEFLFELASSYFTGIIIYLLATGLGAKEYVALGISGTMSYFGTKSLLLVYNRFGMKE